MLDALRRGEPEGRGIAGLGPERAAAAPLLVAALEQDERRHVRLALIAALERMGARDALPALERCIASRDPDVRFAAARAHWRVSAREAPGLRALVDAAAAEDARALRALAGAGSVPPGVVAELERARAIGALGALGPQARSALATVEAALATRPVDAALALYRIDGGTERPLGVLMGRFRAGTDFERAAVLECLLEIASREPEPVARAVAALLDDGDARFREAGAAILGRIGPGAKAAGARLARSAEEDPSPEVRKAAAAALDALR